MFSRPSFRRRSRLVPALAVAAALLTPLGGSLAVADTVPETTPPVTTPAPSPTTPAPSPTPVPSPTPAPLTTLSGAATTATAAWSPPASIVEETKFSLGVAATVNGQVTAHVALLKDASPCPTSPLYPMQTATGTKLTVVPVAPAADAPATTTPVAPSGTVSGTLSVTPKDSGTFSLCGWLVGSPAANEASTVARFSAVVGVANRPATLAAEIPPTVRSGDYFSVKLTGTTPAAGRRVLIMAEKDLTRSCEQLRKAPSGKLALQTVVSLPSGAFTKTLRLRYRAKTSGPYMLCAQIVETVDRTPEATAQATMTVAEGLKCVSTQSALSQRSNDLGVIRKRRDAALARLTAAKKKIAPLKKKVAAVEKASARRVSTARKAVTKAKSAAGKKKARARLAKVRRAETARVYKAGAPLRKANASVKLYQRTYTQYRTGARLLDETLARTKKDVKKYCATS